MKTKAEIDMAHDNILGLIIATIGTEILEPFLAVNAGNPDGAILMLDFSTNDSKAAVAEALKTQFAHDTPLNLIYVCEAVMAEPEEGEKWESAADCRVHYDVITIQIEVAGAVHLWNHRLDGEFPDRTMDCEGQYHRHGPMDWGRFVLMPENQQLRGDPCKSS